MVQGQDLIVVKMPGFVICQLIPGPSGGDLETMKNVEAEPSQWLSG